ncbi:MAG: tungstate ABC transporter substrate-binding protein WtpA [Actinobacteria bacterium]|nr:tungstate ABC transporter substrate-binding protein WtpA [Actinomycetota bacterium]
MRRHCTTARRPGRWSAGLLCLALATGACSPESAEVTPLKVMVAGSLLAPMGAIEEAYEAAHPGIDLLVEGHGSIQVIRRVTELGEDVDIVLTSDAALIPMLMYQAVDEETGRPYAEWYVEVASNRMALAYTPGSRYAGEISGDNWPEVLGRPDVRIGLSDPRFDPSGYRTLMILAMAQEVYDDPTLLVDLTLGQLTPPVAPVVEEGRTIVHVPELLAPTDSSRIVMRGSSTQLVALLQTGDIDYAFEYESVIRQNGLEMVRLPAALDLGSDAEAGRYAGYGVVLDSQRFSTVDPAFDGGVIAYGATVPTNAPHPDEAAEFIAFLLGEEGRAVMTASHHSVFDHPEADHHDALPEVLRDLTVPKDP